MSDGYLMDDADPMSRVGRLDNDIGWGLYNARKEINEWTCIMGDLGMAKTPYELTSEDMRAKRFSSVDKAEEFFNCYARATGFGVRKSHKKKNAKGELRSRTWLCCKEGHRSQKFLDMQERKKEAKLLTREDCQVMLRVNLVNDSTAWEVAKFVTAHSHPLAPATHMQFLNSNRQVNGGALKTAEAMHAAGIRKCSIMGFMSNQVGGFNNIQFLIKDLYNKMSSHHRNNISDSDAAAAIGYLHHKCAQDNDFYGKYTTDNEDRVQHIFWSDSRSRMDYGIFGHTLAFDATYRTNRYGKPLVVLVGINNHFNTTIFGFCLLADETIDSYMWALHTFVECMDGKKPSTVITDGDLAMKAAISASMPNSTHRICQLHLMKNVCANVKDPLFPGAFQKVMRRHYSEEEFANEWGKLVRRFNLEGSTWAASMYDKRQSWAETFLRGHFFGGMSTTQRSEGMHAYLKSNVKGSITVLQLVRSMDAALDWLRQKEAHEDFLSTYSKPVTNVTNMSCVEDEVATIYTRRMFYRVREEIRREGMYSVANAVREGDIIKWELSKYSTHRVVRVVSVHVINNLFRCQCFLYESIGIPCRHIFATMKAMRITKLPPSLICGRWSKSARADTGTRQGERAWTKGIDNNTDRFGYLLTKSSELCHLASVDDDKFKFAVRQIEELVTTLRQMPDSNYESKRRSPEQTVPTHKPLHNPAYARSKGSGLCGIFGGKRKKCSNCRRSGHNKKTCMLPTESRDTNNMYEDLLAASDFSSQRLGSQIVRGGRHNTEEAGTSRIHDKGKEKCADVDFYMPQWNANTKCTQSSTSEPTIWPKPTMAMPDGFPPHDCNVATTHNEVGDNVSHTSDEEEYWLDTPTSKTFPPT